MGMYPKNHVSPPPRLSREQLLAIAARARYLRAHPPVPTPEPDVAPEPEPVKAKNIVQSICKKHGMCDHHLYIRNNLSRIYLRCRLCTSDAGKRRIERDRLARIAKNAAKLKLWG